MADDTITGPITEQPTADGPMADDTITGPITEKHTADGPMADDTMSVPITEWHIGCSAPCPRHTGCRGWLAGCPPHAAARSVWTASA